MWRCPAVSSGSRVQRSHRHDDGVDQIVPERRMQVRHPARMVCVSLPLCMSLCMSFCMPMVCSASHIPTHTDACRAELHALSIRCMPCRPECLADMHVLYGCMPSRSLQILSLITCKCPCLVAFLLPYSAAVCAHAGATDAGSPWSQDHWR